MSELKTSEAIIQKIETDRAKLVRLYRSVPVTAVEKAELPNGWSVKDVLGHLAAWEWYCVDRLQESQHTVAPTETEIDTDSINRNFYEERAEWSWEEIEYDFRAAHAELLRTIRAFPQEMLGHEQVQEWIGENTWEHYEEHFDDLQRWHRRHTGNRSH